MVTYLFFIQVLFVELYWDTSKLNETLFTTLDRPCNGWTFNSWVVDTIDSSQVPWGEVLNINILFIGWSFKQYLTLAHVLVHDTYTMITQYSSGLYTTNVLSACINYFNWWSSLTWILRSWRTLLQIGKCPCNSRSIM